MQFALLDIPTSDQLQVISLSSEGYYHLIFFPLLTLRFMNTFQKVAAMN